MQSSIPNKKTWYIDTSNFPTKFPPNTARLRNFMLSELQPAYHSCIRNASTYHTDAYSTHS